MTGHEQLPLFSEQTTSLEAAVAIAPHVQRLQAKVLDALRINGALTCEGICDRAHMDGNTVRPRLVELQEMGLVEECEGRGTTRSGRSAKVYQASEKHRLEHYRTL